MINKRCRLAAPDCVSMDAVYDAFTRDLDMPGHFGRNLDALWDSLSADVEGPYEIVVADIATLVDMDDPAGEEFIGLLVELAAEREDVRIVFNEP